ncbi:hypothetical protein Lfu02_32360 [Longispora fulva]|uniref:DUF4878 domain-containing protein n=1 Tax=Longispora fulva TaxID=619741 RepID=A0A8J7GEW6_9ACTN|nr:hypothetical protein [Longispora fulva]MBG6139368.1 hypothetical protein [Longispora fulva]GIG58864.1 hypothetical protein Lfu02_32360 [Longispora fulva]
MRARSGLITSLVFGVVLLLCVGGGTGAFLLVSSLEGKGARTPTAAVEGFLTGVFVQRDEDRAADFLCSDVDPTQLAQKVSEVDSLVRRYPDVTFTWTTEQKSKAKRETVYDVRVTAKTPAETVGAQHLEVTATSNGGWRVCGVKRVAA